MRAVRSRDVRSTEKHLRALMVASGLRGWRIYATNLPGSPDFVFPTRRLAVFVDGCFWHGCPVCYRRPHSRRNYWDAKVAGNIARDRHVNRTLRRQGWRVVRIWEHELRRGMRAGGGGLKVLRRIRQALQSNRTVAADCDRHRRS